MVSDIAVGSAAETGKQRRLLRLFSKDGRNRCVICPVDDSLIAGPIEGLEDLNNKLQRIVAARPDGVLLHPGALIRFSHILRETPVIVNLTASTIRSTHTRKVRTWSVRAAVRMGADAVAAHLNLTSKFESEMLETAAQISEDCDSAGIPFIAIVYPRKEGTSGDENYFDLRDNSKDEYTSLVSHCARVAVELGASIVKVPYTGTVKSFEKVVESACGIPVIVAGGPLVDVDIALRNAHEVIEAGGAGPSFGRNTFGRDDPFPLVRALRDIAHNDISTKEAKEIYLRGGY